MCRCTEKFPYYYNGKKHIYYPDFIVDDTIYEIKNYYNDLVEAKANSIPHNIKYKLLLKEDMKFYVEYCKTKYGIRFWEILYENN